MKKCDTCLKEKYGYLSAKDTTCSECKGKRAHEFLLKNPVYAHYREPGRYEDGTLYKPVDNPVAKFRKWLADQ